MQQISSKLHLCPLLRSYRCCLSFPANQAVLGTGKPKWGAGTGAGEHRRCSEGMHDRMWHVCGHFSAQPISGVWEFSMESVGVWSSPCCATGKTKPLIKPCSAPCPGQSLCSPVLGESWVGGFCTNILLADGGTTHSSPGHQPGLALPAEHRSPSLARGKVDLPAAMLVWGTSLWENIPPHCIPQFPVQWCKILEFVRYGITGPGLQAGRRAV